MYLFLKFLHVVSIIAWVGGVIMLVFLNRRFMSLGNSEVLRALGEQGKSLAMALFMPAMLIAIVTGIGMVQVGHLSFGAVWISWGFMGAIVSFILGGVLTAGTAKKLATKIQQGTATPADIAATQRRILLLATLNLLILLSVVWAMVVKP
jgi:uncharacterized membrane protein